MSMIVRLLLLAVVVAGEAVAGVTTYTFTNASGDGLWSNPVNWDLGLPTPFSDVVIPVNKTATLDFDSSSEQYSLVDVSGTLIIAANGVLSGPGAVPSVGIYSLQTSTLQIEIGGTVNLEGGTLAFIDVTQGDGGAGHLVAYNPGTFLNALNNVIIDSNVVLDLSQQPGAFCTLVQGTVPNPSDSSQTTSLAGLTVNGNVQIGSLDGIIAAAIYCQGITTLGGAGTINFGANPLNAITEQTGGALLTIGDGSNGLTIDGINGTITALGTSAGPVLVVSSNATVSSDSGGTITLVVGKWDVEGLVEAVNQSSSTVVINADGTGVLGQSDSNAEFFASIGTLSVIGTGSWQYFPVLGIECFQGGTINLGGAWHSGLVDATPGSIFISAGTVNLGGSFTATDASAILSDTNEGVAQSTFNITGVMDNLPQDNPDLAGLTLSVAIANMTNRQWFLIGGTINGGTIYGHRDAFPIDSTLYGTDLGGTLVGVTIDASTSFELSQVVADNGSPASATIASGLTVNGLVSIGNPLNSNGIAGTLAWVDSQTWSGTGTISFGQQPNGNAIIQSSPVANSILTIAHGLTITGGQGTIFANLGNSTLVNQGTITASVPEQTLTLNVVNWVNSGTISADDACSLVITASGTGSNYGFITTVGGNISIITTGFSPWTNYVASSATTGILINGGSGTLGNWIDATTGNVGFQLKGNATLNITGGSATTAQLLAILANSTAITTVNIIGVLDNTANTLDLGTGPVWNLGDTGQIIAGTITNGTLFVAAANTSLKNGVVIDSETTLDLANNSNAACTVIGNITINGTVQLGDETPAQLNWQVLSGSAVTWGGQGVINFGNSGSSINDSVPSAGTQTLNFGDGSSGLTISSGSGTITTASNDDLVLAADAVISTTEGSTITFSGGASLDNHGSIGTEGGSIVFTGIGTLINEEEASIQSQGASSTVTFDAIGSTISNDGDISATNGGQITGSSPDAVLANGFTGTLTSGQVEDESPSSIALTFHGLTSSGEISDAAGSTATATVTDWTNYVAGTVTITGASSLLAIYASGDGSNIGTMTSNGSLVISGGTWTNYGTITSNQGTVYLGGRWNNNQNSDGLSGSMIDTDSIFYLGGGFISDEFSFITVNNDSGTGEIHLCGSMDGSAEDNAINGGVLDLSLQSTSEPSNVPSWLLDGGTLTNVTLNDQSGEGLALVVTTVGLPSQLGGQNFTIYGNNPGTLDGVTVGVDGEDSVLLDLSVNNGAACFVLDGLTVNSSIQLGGVVNIHDSATASLVWVGSQTWSGVGAIDFGSVSTNTIADGNGESADNILTIDTTLTINAGTGTINATSQNSQLVDNGTITNNSGSLQAGLTPIVPSTMTVVLGGNSLFVVGGSGTLVIEPGTSITVAGDYQQLGTLNVSIGTPNSPPAVPTTQTLNALNVTGGADISSGSILVNAVPGYPPIGGATNASFVVVTSIDQLSGLFSGRSPGAGIPGNFQVVADAPDQVVSVQIVQPTVGLSYPAEQSASTNLSPLSFVVTATEAIYFPGGNGSVAVTNGAITSILPATIGAASSAFTVTVAPFVPGTVTLSIPAGAAVDTFGVPALASNPLSYYFDNTPIIATISPNGTSTNSSSIQFTLTFTKALFGPPTLSTSGGTPAVITGTSSPNVYHATVTASGTGSPATPVTVSLATTGAVDPEGNNLAAAVSATVTFDTVAPTVVITPNGTLTNAANIPFTLTFSKPVALVAAGLQANHGTLGSLTGGPTVWTVPVSPSGQGSVGLTVLAPPSANAVVDLAGNPLAAAVTATVTSDTTPPAVVAFTPSGSATNASPIPFTITFTKAVTLDAAGVTVTNGTLTAISPGPATSFTLEVTPDAAAPPLTVTVAVAGSAVVDAAGNAMATPATTVVTYDNAPLTTVITPSGTTQPNPPIVFTITFGAALVAAPTLTDITITNGTASAVTTVSPTVYTVSVAPIAIGAVFLQIAGGVVSDAAGNLNQPAIAVVNYSTSAPSVVVTPLSGTSALSPVVFTLTFSTAVSGLTTAGLVSNGTIGALTPVGGGGTTYTVAVTPSGFGTVTLQVLASAAVDSSDHGNTTSNIGSIDYTVVTAATPVTVTVVPAAPTANTSPLLFTLSFSVPVAGLTLADLVVTNGTASNLLGSGASYTVDVTPNGDGPVSVAVLPNVATDSAGTGNLASPPATVIYHATPPAAALAFDASVPVTVASFPLTISFSEPVTGFTVSALTIANGTASAFTAIDASNYSATITPLQPVTASVIATIPAGACQDAFGNANLAATITIPLQSGQLSSGVVTPAIALSPATSTVFTAICPGTLGGLAQVQNFLNGVSPAQARAFVWDATLQDFVGVPAQAPTGGWQPFQGVFIATRVPTAFNFNGYMTTFDFTLTLLPGWNFVGIPPLDDNGTPVTTHQWSDLQLEDASGNIISGPERVNLIDVGAWAWNGSAYTQVSGTLSTGQGYWIDNSSSPGVNLVLRRLSPSELSADLGALRAAQSAQGGTSSQDAAATIGYTAHGTPPPPPSSASQNDSPGHGCGLGSGVGALILGLVLVLRLRLRSRR